MSALDYIKINTLDYGFAVIVKSKEYSETHACENRESVMQLIRDELYPVAPDGEASVFEERVTPPPPPEPDVEETKRDAFEIPNQSFAMNDRVECNRHGAGTVVDDQGGDDLYPLRIEFDKTIDGKQKIGLWYSRDGRIAGFECDYDARRELYLRPLDQATEGSYEFGVGDEVYCKALGRGRVTDHRGSGLTYPLEVTFENDPEPEVYTVDGKWQIDEEDDIDDDSENDFIRDRKLSLTPF